MRGDAFIHFVCGSRRVNIRLGVLLLFPKSLQITYVIVRFDDNFVSGKNDIKHIRNMEEVLKRLSKLGLRLEKICFCDTRGDLLWIQGHCRGCHTSESKYTNDT